ncbi:hypothetical protein [Enterococcus sp. HY326]|uniref:hypothetical protein n=1 Tax=Enterococcus sp. HY326 TaxID=2971265 RepID=UPI002240AF1E|nr:hypothetical protein [Enterococcus sp. HY326]
MSKNEFTTLDDWKVGWWQKGNQIRYCYGVHWFGLTPMVKYRTKAAHLSNTRKVTALNPVVDEWFPKAEYLGLELVE